MTDEQLASLIENLAANGSAHGWQGWIERLGLPIAILVLLVFATAKLARFLAPMVRNAFQAHGRFLEKTEQKLANDSTAIKALADNQEKQTTLIARILEMENEESATLEQLDEKVDKLVARCQARQANGA